MALEKWTVLYNIRDDGAQSTFNGVGTEGWKAGAINVEGTHNKSLAYLLEEKGGLISGTPQSCKIVTVEAESEKECWAALQKALGTGNANGPALTVLASGLKEQKGV